MSSRSVWIRNSISPFKRLILTRFSKAPSQTMITRSFRSLVSKPANRWTLRLEWISSFKSWSTTNLAITFCKKRCSWLATTISVKRSCTPSSHSSHRSCKSSMAKRYWWSSKRPIQPSSTSHVATPCPKDRLPTCPTSLRVLSTRATSQRTTATSPNNISLSQPIRAKASTTVNNLNLSNQFRKVLAITIRPTTVVVTLTSNVLNSNQQQRHSSQRWTTTTVQI